MTGADSLEPSAGPERGVTELRDPGGVIHVRKAASSRGRTYIENGERPPGGGPSTDEDVPDPTKGNQMVQEDPNTSDGDRTAEDPYSRGAQLYRERGHLGAIPCDVDGKPGSVEAGFTGGVNWGSYPTDEDVAGWIDPKVKRLHPRSLALRLSEDGVGVDVDDPDLFERWAGDPAEFKGWEDWTRGALSPLPGAWSSTSRGKDSDRRKYVYRAKLPLGRRWRDGFPGGDVLHHGKRYVRCWPSTNGRTGAVELWYGPDRQACSDLVPTDEELYSVDLQPEWVEALTEPVGGSALDLAGSGDGDEFDWHLALTPHAVYASGGAQQTTLYRAAWSLSSQPGISDRLAVQFLERVVACFVDKDEADPWTPEAAREMWVRVRYRERPVAELPEGYRSFTESVLARQPPRLLVEPEPEPFLDGDGTEIPEGVLRRYVEKLEREWADQLVHDTKAAAEPSEWVDVKAIVAAGVEAPEPPSVFEFADGSGRGLLYPGRLNALFGDGGVGKSLLTAALQAEHVEREEHVVHLEYDNNPARQVVWRVVAAGADPKKVAEFFHVLVGIASIPAFDFEPGLVTLDSLNAAMSAFDGVEVNASGRGVDTVVRKLVAPFTERGATGLWLDHVGHQAQDRPTNNRRKIQAVQGVMLRAEPVGTPGGVGTRWSTRLVVTKDNPGWSPVPVGQVVGFAVFDGREKTVDPETGEVKNAGTCRVSLQSVPLATVAPVYLSEADRAQQLVLAVVEETPPQATVTKRDVLGLLADRGEELTDSTVKRALDQLYAAGQIAGEQRGQHRTAPWHFYPIQPGADGDGTPSISS